MDSTPAVYSAATDQATLKEALDLGTKIMVGHIFGIAGIIIGISRIREIKGFALLVDTLGMYPDAAATKQALILLNKFLNLKVDLTRVESAAEQTKKQLESFGLVRNIQEEKKKEEQALRWFI